MFEMMKDGDVSGAQLLKILKNHIVTETSDSVISDSL